MTRLILKFTWKRKELRTAKTTLKKNKVGEVAPTDFFLKHLYWSVTALQWCVSAPSDFKNCYKTMGFPRGAVVKNPPANAGDTGSSPGSGRIPHAAEQLSPCATTTEPVL